MGEVAVPVTLLLPPRPPWVLLDIDTTPPVLHLTAPGVIQPPDVLVARVHASEPVCEWSAYFIDTLGIEHALGIDPDAQPDPQDLLVSLPTVGMPTGRGTLRVLARDCACNVGQAEWPVFVDRPRPYDLSASSTGMYEMTAHPDHTDDLLAESVTVLDLETEHDEAAEMQAVTVSMYDLSTEVRDGG